VITVYMTGVGTVDNPAPDGVPAPLNVVSRSTLAASATIGGMPATIRFLGLSPGYVGVSEADIVVPVGAGGEVPVLVTIGGVQSNLATIQLN
jgi:uncharacterized protein (TIGR03437 family)